MLSHVSCHCRYGFHSAGNPKRFLDNACSAIMTAQHHIDDLSDGGQDEDDLNHLHHLRLRRRRRLQAMAADFAECRIRAHHKIGLPTACFTTGATHCYNAKHFCKISNSEHARLTVFLHKPLGFGRG